MIGGKRKTIGIFICKTYEMFERAVFSAMHEEALQRDYDVVVFTSVGYFASQNYYDTQEKQMFAFAPIERLDGILVAPDTYEIEGFREALYKELDERADCPVVAIRHQSDKFDCTFTDEAKAFRPLLNHLIRDHGKKKIRFLAGYKGHPDGEIRLDVYREVMAENGLPVDEEKDIFHGNMWYNCGISAFDALIRENDWPEAVVCANDYMAAGLISVMRERGVRVPEDIMVTGFDNVQNLSMGAPMMTTVEQDFSGMVHAAMAELDRQIHAGEHYRGRKEKRKIGLPGTLELGETCGCGHRDAGYYKQLSEEARQRVDAMGNREVGMTYLTIEMNTCDDLKQMHQVLVDKKEDTPMLQDFYVCLFEENGSEGTEHRYATRMTDTACLVHAMQDRKDFGMPEIRFERSRLLPSMGERKEPQIIYLMLLHQMEYAYGYAMFHYLTGEMPSNFFQHWNVILSNALSNIHKRNELLALYEERRLSSITDPVTRLLNRRGLEEKMHPTWPVLCGDRTSIAFISCDMDRLKYINDTFGHQAGDYAIQTIARSLQAPVGKDAAVVRMGGDEFLTVLPGADQAEADRYIREFEKELERNNERDRKPFKVGASIAAAVTRLDWNTTMEDCIRLSDEAMYNEKKKHKEGAFRSPPGPLRTEYLYPDE